MLCFLAACASCGNDSRYEEEKPLIYAYVDAWKNENYKTMYSLLSPEAKEKILFEKFTKKLKADREINGGVKSASSLKQLASDNVDAEWSMTLNYKRSTARSSQIRAQLEKKGKYWTIKGGGLLPLDISPFNR
jgi:hypothetical protein